MCAAGAGKSYARSAAEQDCWGVDNCSHSCHPGHSRDRALQTAQGVLKRIFGADDRSIVAFELTREAGHIRLAVSNNQGEDRREWGRLPVGEDLFLWAYCEYTSCGGFALVEG